MNNNGPAAADRYERAVGIARPNLLVMTIMLSMATSSNIFSMAAPP
jgi:hypothetical protein